MGFAIKSCAMLRNRMLADPSFLFKIGTEVCLLVCFFFFIYGMFVQVSASLQPNRDQVLKWPS